MRERVNMWVRLGVMLGQWVRLSLRMRMSVTVRLREQTDA